MAKSRRQRQGKDATQRRAGTKQRAERSGENRGGRSAVDGGAPRQPPTPSPPKPNRLLLGISASVFAVWAAYLLILVVAT